MNEIQVKESNQLEVAGLQMSRSALAIPENVTDEQTSQIGKFLQSVEGSKSWWWGDFLVAIEKRKGEHYANEWVEMAGLDSASLRQYKWCADFFEPSSRLDSLSFSHHYEAMAGSSGDLAVAQDWLDRAAENGWSKSQLRKEIRLASRQDEGYDPGPPALSFAPLIQADCWAVGGIEQVRQLPKKERERLWAQIQGIVSVVDFLRQDVSG